MSQHETATITLPDKPSALIRLALADLAKCEADPRYRVDMDAWHEANSHCSVCFAGAVIANTFGAPHTSTTSPYEIAEGDNNNTYLALVALDAFRMGWVSAGMRWMRLGQQALKDRRITSYADSPTRFRADMETLASDLEREGL